MSRKHLGDNANVEVVRNNGYVVVLQIRKGETVEILRNNTALTREEFLEEYRVGDLLKLGVVGWCRIFIARRVADGNEILDKVLDWMGLSNDEIW